MNKLFHRLLGRGQHDDSDIEANSQVAHDIKNQVVHDVISIQAEIDRVNKETNRQLKVISKNLGAVTKKIAIVTGARKRGYNG